MRYLFYKIPDTIKRSLSGRNTIFLSVGIILTIVCVLSGFDWIYFTSVRNPNLNDVFFPALLIGFFLPVFLPALLYLISKTRESQVLELCAWALAQSAALAWLASSALKFFSGRIQPNLGDLKFDISRDFNFGFYEHGIFWGWPSSHTTVAFATMFTLIILLSVYRRKSIYVKIVSAIALVYAFYVGFGVSLSIHWFSDFVAGAILGTVVGLEVGYSFLPELKRLTNHKKTI